MFVQLSLIIIEMFFTVKVSFSFFLNLVLNCKSLKTYENNEKKLFWKEKRWKNYYVTKRYTVKILSIIYVYHQIENDIILFSLSYVASHTRQTASIAIIALSVHGCTTTTISDLMVEIDILPATFILVLSKIKLFWSYFFLVHLYDVFSCSSVMGWGAGVFRSKKLSFFFLCLVARSLARSLARLHAHIQIKACQFQYKNDDVKYLL